MQRRTGCGLIYCQTILSDRGKIGHGRLRNTPNLLKSQLYRFNLKVSAVFYTRWGFPMSRLSLMNSASALAITIVLSLLPFGSGYAQAVAQAQTGSVESLPDVDVRATKNPAMGSEAEVLKTPPVVERFQLPQTSTSTTAEKIQTQVNIVDTEDAVKYEPSLFLRKRNYGDTSPVLATRIWGVNSSARTLVYGDDVLLSSLIANNNSMGSTRFGLVSPDDIQRIDFLYGPYAAAYPGNSMGGVMQITTKMPDQAVANIKQTEAFQQFKWYGVKDTYSTHQTSGEIGNRHENFAWQLNGSFTDSHSQPLTWVTTTNPTVSAGGSGLIVAPNKYGYQTGASSGTTGIVYNPRAYIAGAGGLLHTQMTNLNLKTSFDITPWLTAKYVLGFWSNNGTSSVQTFLNTAGGAPTFDGISGFASARYTINAKHVTNAFSLKTDTKGEWDWEIAVNRYDMIQDLQRTPSNVSGATGFTTDGKALSYAGTNWMNGDIKGVWRSNHGKGDHEVSFGVHSDQYQLKNPTYQLNDWTIGSSSNVLYAKNLGQTNTTGLWVQDAWKLSPSLKLTLGAREEFWGASNGMNYTTNSAYPTPASITTTNQPSLSATKTSPKASLNYIVNQDWDVTGSFGQAYRFPTVGELYQTNGTGTTLTIGNPALKPEEVLSSEVVLQRKFDEGKIRLSLFNEYVNDALISQTVTATNSSNVTVYPSFVSNVDRVRNRGVELSAQKDNVFIEGLQWSGSVTWVNSRIEADSAWTRPATNTPVPVGMTTVVGNKVPYVPEWRSSMVATYRPNDNWAFSFGGRYYGKMFSTLENIDLANNAYTSFNPFTVLDARIQYKYKEHATISIGVDNIANQQYTLYHPFPGRTFVIDAKIKF